MPVRIILGMAVTVIGFGIAARRFHWLSRLIRCGQARPVPHPGPHQPQGRGGGHRGGRAAQAPAVDDPRPGPLLHHVGLHHPAADHHRGLRRPLQQVLPHPRHRNLGLGRLHRGLLRLRRPRRPGRLRRHPAQECPVPPRAQVTLLRHAHRRRLAGPPHDRRRHDHAPPLPGRPDQHQPHPVPLLGLEHLRLTCRGASSCTPSGPAPTASWSPSSCSSTSPSSPASSSSSRTPSTCTSSSRPSTSPSPAARGRWAPSVRRRTWTWRTSTRTPCSAWARSVTSPGSRCSTSPPAPSADAASRPARPGPPTSRCRPSCSS